MDKKQIRADAKDYGVPIIRTKSHELLIEAVKKSQPKQILEIGTAVGYSGIAMLSSTAANLLTIEHNNDYIRQAKKNFAEFGFSKRVKILKGDCLVALANLVSNSKYNEFFDFIFLDGPKAQYEQMLELLLILLKKGGTLVIDNVLFRGYVLKTEEEKTRRYKTIIKRLNSFIEKCKNHPKLCEFELKNIEDGMIFVKKVEDEK